MTRFPDPKMDALYNDIIRLITLLDDPVAMAQYEEEMKLRRAIRRAKHERKIAALYDALTDKCEALVAAYKQSGYEVNKFFTDRGSGNVAVMLVKRNVWNHEKSRMGHSLVMVYPDGSRSETREKSISVKREF